MLLRVSFNIGAIDLLHASESILIALVTSHPVALR